MGKSIKGTRTEKNLMVSFAGESQARMRYTYFASAAKKEGYEQIAAIFTETADQEKEHAKRMFKWLEGGKVEITASFPAGVIGTTLENLKAAAAGVVKSVKTDDETGTTVTVDIGSGYEVKYGQLKNLNVKTGQKIAKGEIVGHIAKPTKYYTLEGSNLYFEVTENGKSVDPLLLLK